MPPWAGAAAWRRRRRKLRRCAKMASSGEGRGSKRQPPKNNRRLLLTRLIRLGIFSLHWDRSLSGRAFRQACRTPAHSAAKWYSRPQTRVNAERREAGSNPAGSTIPAPCRPHEPGPRTTAARFPQPARPPAGMILSPVLPPARVTHRSRGPRGRTSDLIDRQASAVTVPCGPAAPRGGLVS